MYNHYEACDTADNLYVLNTLIPSLKPGMSERFFLFFAANWAKDWADPARSRNLSTPTTTPRPTAISPRPRRTSTWRAARRAGPNRRPTTGLRYQVTPQAGCPYLQAEVDGAAGAQLGINLMAAKTSAHRNVLRSATIGEDYVRTFAAAGVNNLVMAAVNSFANYSYTVRFTCVNPTIQILEPLQTKFALVGAPDSPIGYLARWTVLDGANSVRGLPESSFTFDAEGGAATVVPGSFQEVGDEYWAILMPPTKPLGTTFVDFRINLGANDTELDALLYQPRQHRHRPQL